MPAANQNSLQWHPATYKKEQAKGELKKVSRTPYQTRLDALQKAWTNLVDFLKNEKFVFLPITDGSEEQAIRQVVIDDPLADAVRQYCVRSLKEKQIERSDIMRSLYHPGDGKPISRLPRFQVERLALTHVQSVILTLIWLGSAVRLFQGSF